MVEGATLRLSLAQPDASGRIDGVLAIDLEPGWKTYWIDPGPVGLAPTLDFSASIGVADPQIRFPAPVRFREGDAQSVGYDAPALVPFTLRHTNGGSVRAELRLQIGLCRELCVPVVETLAAEPSDSLSVRAEILAAQRNLPEPQASGAATLHFDGSQLVAEVPVVDGAAPPNLFPSGGSAWRIDQPLGPPVRQGDHWRFSFPARLANAQGDAILPTVDLVLTGAGRAQSFDGVPVQPSPPPSSPLPNEAEP